MERVSWESPKVRLVSNLCVNVKPSRMHWHQATEADLRDHCRCRAGTEQSDGLWHGGAHMQQDDTTYLQQRQKNLARHQSLANIQKVFDMVIMLVIINTNDNGDD